jgi:hypothetical protein
MLLPTLTSGSKVSAVIFTVSALLREKYIETAGF